MAMDSLKFHPAPPWLLRPSGRTSLKRYHGCFKDGTPAGRAACGRLLPLWTPHAVCLCMTLFRLLYHSCCHITWTPLSFCSRLVTCSPALSLSTSSFDWSDCFVPSRTLHWFCSSWNLNSGSHVSKMGPTWTVAQGCQATPYCARCHPW
jgi:hypothetical protein